MRAVLLLIALSAPGAALAAGGPAPLLPVHGNGCIASLREFAYELSSAVEVGDVNRLAALYRWRGVSTRTGYSIMERLQVLAGRPLLQVDPVYPAPPPPPAFDPGLPEPPPQGPPIGLRLRQTLRDGTTAASTTLWLRRELGCWWVTLRAMP